MPVTAVDGWWGPQPDPRNGVLQYQVGPLEALIEHHDLEWRIAYQHHLDRQADTTWTRTQAPSDRFAQLDDSYKVQRHRITRGAGRLLILPALADRPVVSRPLHPLHIHPGERLTIYVGSPLWFQVRLDPTGSPLIDIPIQRPSDTWFGPSTRYGELCYASRTHARLSLDDLPVRSMRAATPVSIENDSDEPLVVEKLSLPVCYLSLFTDGEGRIWTETLQVLCERGGEQARIEIEPGAPRNRHAATCINQPRQEAPASFIQALNALFG